MLNPLLLSEGERLWSRSEVLVKPSPTPAAPGVYGWYFDEIPGSADGEACHAMGAFSLLYVGISPKGAARQWPPAFALDAAPAPVPHSILAV
jgi:hypothetical protein